MRRHHWFHLNKSGPPFSLYILCFFVPCDYIVRAGAARGRIFAFGYGAEDRCKSLYKQLSLLTIVYFLPQSKNAEEFSFLVSFHWNLTQTAWCQGCLGTIQNLHWKTAGNTPTFWVIGVGITETAFVCLVVFFFFISRRWNFKNY